MTTIQRIAQLFGVVLLLIGILGFFTTGMSMDANPESAPRLFGLFPVNVLHNIVHLAFGVWGLLASRSFDASKSYATISGAIYLVLTILAFIDPTTFGLVPIGSHDVWLHALIAIVLLGAGLTARRTEPATTTA